MYSFNSRVRFSETDKEGRLTLEAIVDYFQDCSTFQSEDLGVGFSYLQSMDLTWVLSYWQIVVEEYPVLGDIITVGTHPYEFKGFLGARNFYMINDQGKRVVTANSLWTLLNMKKMVPQRPLEEIVKTYPVEEKIPMDYAPRKIAVTGEEKQEDPITIQKHHLDCNGHVNNGQYIRISAVYLPDDFKIYQLRAEYKRQARLGDILYPYCYKDSVDSEENKKITICLCDAEKNPYTIVEFSR